MKVLFFCNLVPGKQGSFERMLGFLGREFSRAGDTLILVLAGEPIAAVASDWSSAGIRWMVLRGWTDARGREHPWRFCVPAVRIARRVRPDVAVVHFGNELPSLAAALGLRLTGRSRVRWVWQQDQQIADPSGWRGRMNRLRWLSGAFDRFVAVYDGGRRSLERRGVPSDAIAVIRNAVADHVPQRSPGWLRPFLGVASDAVVAVMTASLIARKRPGFAIEAFARATSGATGAEHLVILGDGPLRAESAALARRRGAEARVHFLGLRNDVRDLLAEADLYVHTSSAETCTYAVSEAMCARLPVVMTEAGAAREQVLEGETGFVLAPDDLAGFAGRVRLLLDDAGQRRAMGEAGRARWARMLRVEDQARAYHALYRRLAEGDSGIR